MRVVFAPLINLVIATIVLYFCILAKVIGFEPVAMRISLFPYRLGNRVRYQFYRKHLQKVGENVTFSLGCLVTNIKTTIGNNVRLGPYNTIGLAHLGDDIITAQHVHILSGSKQHSYADKSIPIWRQKGLIQCVELKGDNWIGANVVVMANVGVGSIVGSGSIVVSDIPDMIIAAGNPCKKLKDRP